MLYSIIGIILIAIGITMLAKPRLVMEYQVWRRDVYAGRYLRPARSIPILKTTHEIIMKDLYERRYADLWEK